MFRDLYFLLSTLCSIEKRKSFFKSVYSDLKELYSETRGIILDDEDQYIRGNISDNMATDLILIITDKAEGGDILFNEKNCTFSFVYFVHDPLKTEHTPITLFDMYFGIVEYLLTNINFKVNINSSLTKNSIFKRYIDGIQYIMALSLTMKLFPEEDYISMLMKGFHISENAANTVAKISRYKFDGIPLYDGYKVGLAMSDTID